MQPQVSNSQPTINEHLDLEVVPRARSIEVLDVLIRNNHTIDQLLPGDGAPCGRIEVVQQRGDARQRKMGAKRLGVAVVSGSESDISITADEKDVRSLPIQGDAIRAC